MIAVFDTNVLVRLITKDDPAQVEAATNLFFAADRVIVPAVVFCELVWVLSRSYKCPAAFISAAIRQLMNNEKVITEDDVVLAGLEILDKGGDFADGVVQYTGSHLAGGPSTFVSFDRDAVHRLSAGGAAALVPC